MACLLLNSVFLQSISISACAEADSSCRKSVCVCVRSSVRHTPTLYQNRASLNRKIFANGFLKDCSFRIRTNFPEIRKESPGLMALNERG